MRDTGVVVFDQDAERIERTNDAISRLGLILRGLPNQLAVAAAPALGAVADAMAAVARTTGPPGIAIRKLFDNLGRLTSDAAGIATLMGGRLVAAKTAAAALLHELSRDQGRDRHGAAGLTGSRGRLSAFCRFRGHEEKIVTTETEIRHGTTAARRRVTARSTPVSCPAMPRTP